MPMYIPYFAFLRRQNALKPEHMIWVAFPQNYDNIG
jgi:hypothetical protein